MLDMRDRTARKIGRIKHLMITKRKKGDEEIEALAVRTLMRQQATPSRSRTNDPATTGQEAPRAAGVHQHDVDWLLDPRLVEAHP